MKKVFLTLALAAFAFAANAQFVVGGHIGYNTTGANQKSTITTGTNVTEPIVPGNEYTNMNTSALTILPRIGYQLTDKIQVGASFGVTWQKEVDYSAWLAEYATVKDFEGWTRTTEMGIQIAPYVRYNVTEFGNFTLFCEAKLGFRLGMNPKVHNYNVAYTDAANISHDAVDEDVVGYSQTSTTISLNVMPGLNYKFDDNFSVDLYLNVLGLGFESYTRTTTTDYTVVPGYAGPTPNEVERVYTRNTFDFIANMNDNYTVNTLFTIGFNYAF